MGEDPAEGGRAGPGAGCRNRGAGGCGLHLHRWRGGAAEWLCELQRSRGLQGAVLRTLTTMPGVSLSDILSACMILFD